MAIVYTDDQNYSDIADAIREKNGTTETYKPAEMAAAIMNLESGGGSSGGGPVSWNDLTDKPFGVSRGAAIVEETTVTLATMEGAPFAFYESTNELALTDGASYVVTYGDKDYLCSAALVTGTPILALGNLSLIQPSLENTGEPFAIVGAPLGGSGAGYTLCGTDAGEIEFAFHEAEVAKLDKAYLPDGVIIKSFDLTAMGLPPIPLDGTEVTVNADNEVFLELRMTAYDSPVKITFNAGTESDYATFFVIVNGITEHTGFSYTTVTTEDGTFYFSFDASNMEAKFVAAGSGSGGSAYDDAVDGGYTGTEENFKADLAAIEGLAEFFAYY